MNSVSVNNVSLSASENDIREFFSFTGDIECIDLQRLVAHNSFTYPFLSMSYLSHVGILNFVMNASNIMTP